MQNKKVIVTLSGGADSAVLLYKAAEQYDEVHTVTFDYGQRHESREVGASEKQLLNASVDYPNVTFTNKLLDVKYIKDIAPTSSLTNNDIETPNVKDIMGEAQPKSYVPFRNLMFISILASYAEAIKASEIWYGAAEADSLAGYWDGSAEFVDEMNKLTSLNREYKVTLVLLLLKCLRRILY